MVRVNATARAASAAQHRELTLGSRALALRGSDGSVLRRDSILRLRLPWEAQAYW